MTLTPKQFNILATKDDLKDLKEEMMTDIDRKLDKIITAVDEIAKTNKNHKEEQVANLGAHNRMQEEIEEHDSRIRKLELKTV